MKKLFFLIPLLLLVLCGCGKKRVDETGYSVFYINKDGTKIIKQAYDMQSEDSDGMIEELLSALQTDSDSVNYKRTIPGDVTVNGYELTEMQLSINFGSNYYNMDAMTEVLCRAAVVRTMVQVPEVVFVTFYVDGAPLTDQNGSVVGVMTNDSFVENPGEQINSIQEASITLYFANMTGDGLIKENQSVHYSSNISMEKLVVERLLEGPKNENEQSAIPAGTNLVSVSTVDGICYVNFDEGFLNQNYEIQEAIVIYSIVDSLSELPTVNKVQIAVNGDTSGKYRDDYTFGTLYDRNLDYLVSDGKEEGTETGE